MLGLWLRLRVLCALVLCGAWQLPERVSGAVSDPVSGAVREAVVLPAERVSDAVREAVSWDGAEYWGVTSGGCGSSDGGGSGSRECAAVVEEVFRADMENTFFTVGATLGSEQMQQVEVDFNPLLWSVTHVSEFLCEHVGMPLDNEMCTTKLPEWTQSALERKSYELRAREVALQLTLQILPADTSTPVSARLHACYTIMSSWYLDKANTLPSSAPAPGNTSITFIIPAKGRPLMLLQTVLNLFGKAKYKDHIYVRVVLYANDATSLLVVPLLVAISPNIDIRINTRVDLGYDGIDHLYRLGAEGIQTTLQTVYTDRTHILTAGFDEAIYTTYLRLGQPAFAVMYLEEKNTWGYSYPIQTTRLERLIVGGGYQSPAIDGFLKYLGQCSGMIFHVPGVVVWRQHVQTSTSFKTPLNEATRKEVLFRENEEMKSSLLTACLTVLGHEEYVVLDPDALAAVRSEWFQEPFILNGPTGVL